MKNLSKKLSKTFLNPDQFKAFETNFNNLVQEYRKNGKLTIESYHMLLGKPPVIPNSPDMDARLEAAEELAAYGAKLEQLELILNYEAS